MRGASLLAVLMFAVAAAPEPPARILFQTFPYSTSSESPYGFATANADGSGYVDLTASLLQDHHTALQAAWSPDGSQVVLTLLRTHTGSSIVTAGDIYVIGADGLGARRLTFDGTKDLSNEDPTWSPDGTRIAWRKVRTHGSDVWT